MIKIAVAIGLLQSVLLGSQAAFAVNKCVDSGGNVSYQVEPCPAEQQAKTVNVDSAVPEAVIQEQAAGELVPVLVELPGIGEVAVMAFDNWQVDMQEAGSGAMLTLQNGSAMRIALTYLPRSEPAVADAGVHKDKVRRMAEKYLASSVEETVSMRRLPTPAGVALLSNFNRKDESSLGSSGSEFPSTTIGSIEHKKLSIEIRIETHGTDTSAHDDALEVLASLVVVESLNQSGP